MDCWRNVHNLEHDNSIVFGTWVAALPTGDSRHVLLVKDAGYLEPQELFVLQSSSQRKVSTSLDIAPRKGVLRVIGTWRLHPH